MQPWVMRPWRSTWVASTTTRPAPEFASMPRWARCQSVAQPSTALYWHMGATTMRLSNSTPPSRIGENRMLDMRWGPHKEERSPPVYRSQPWQQPAAVQAAYAQGREQAMGLSAHPTPVGVL